MKREYSGGDVDKIFNTFGIEKPADLRDITPMGPLDFSEFLGDQGVRVFGQFASRDGWEKEYELSDDAQISPGEIVDCCNTLNIPYPPGFDRDPSKMQIHDLLDELAKENKDLSVAPDEEAAPDAESWVKVEHELGGRLPSLTLKLNLSKVALINSAEAIRYCKELGVSVPEAIKGQIEPSLRSSASDSAVRARLLGVTLETATGSEGSLAKMVEEKYSDAGEDEQGITRESISEEELAESERQVEERTGEHPPAPEGHNNNGGNAEERL